MIERQTDLESGQHSVESMDNMYSYQVFWTADGRRRGNDCPTMTKIDCEWKLKNLMNAYIKDLHQEAVRKKRNMVLELTLQTDTRVQHTDETMEMATKMRHFKLVKHFATRFEKQGWLKLEKKVNIEDLPVVFNNHSTTTLMRYQDNAVGFQIFFERD